jgi:hypothetical protein
MEVNERLRSFYCAWSSLRFRDAAAALKAPVPRALASQIWVRTCAVLTSVVEADAAYWSLRFLDVSLWSVMRTADALDKQFALIADQLASVVRKMSRLADATEIVRGQIVALRQTHTLLRIRLSALPYYRWLATEPDTATFDRTVVATQTLVNEHVGKLRHPWLSGCMARLMVAELGALHRICTARDAMLRHRLPQAMCELHRCRATLAAWSDEFAAARSPPHSRVPSRASATLLPMEASSASAHYAPASATATASTTSLHSRRDGSAGAGAGAGAGAERPALMKWLAYVLATLVAKTPLLFGACLERQELLLTAGAHGASPTRAAWAQLAARCGATPTTVAADFVEWCRARTTAKNACVALVMDAAALPRRDRNCYAGFRCARTGARGGARSGERVSSAGSSSSSNISGSTRESGAWTSTAAADEAELRGLRAFPAIFCVSTRTGNAAPCSSEQWTTVVSLFLEMQSDLVAAAESAARGAGGAPPPRAGGGETSRGVHYRYEGDSTYFVVSLGGGAAHVSERGLDRSELHAEGRVDSSLALVIVAEGVRWSRSNRAVADFVKRMVTLLCDAQLLARFEKA